MHTIISAGHSSAVIAAPADSFAAVELRRYLRAATGVELPVVPDARQPERLILGADDVQGDDYVIRREGPALRLGGSTERATLFAVYDFLETVVGCGWLAPADDHVPTLAELVVGDLDRRESPAFAERTLVCFPIGAHTEAQLDWAAKQRLNTVLLAVNNDLDLWERWAARLLPAAARRGLTVHATGHALSAWLPPDRYAGDHPDWFALVHGERRPDLGCCPSAPAAAAEIAANLRRFGARYPDVAALTLWHNDHNDYCECPECAPLCQPAAPRDVLVTPDSAGATAPPPTITDAHLRLVNRVAGQLDRPVEMLAYGRAYPPPATVRPGSDVRVGFAVFDKFCRPAEARVPVADPAHANPDTRRYVQAWRDLTDRFYVYEYYGLYHDFTPLGAVMQADLQWYRSLDVRGISSETAGWNPLHLYTFARLAWNPDEDREALLRQWCSRAYGPAAATMQAFWSLLAATDQQWTASARAESPAPALPPAALDLLATASRELRTRLLDPAAPAAPAAPARDRVRILLGRTLEGPWPWWR